MLWMLIKMASFYCYCFLKLFFVPSNAALYAGFLLYLRACFLLCFWLIAYCDYADKAYLDNHTLLHHGCNEPEIMIWSLRGKTAVLPVLYTCMLCWARIKKGLACKTLLSCFPFVDARYFSGKSCQKLFCDH
uniref:Uncharacterized protein n=1 Tax=Ixodes ricinus TaxID=34613 RepID=A0A6B0URG2_IXORI